MHQERRFNPEMLHLARLSRDMTQIDLANHASTTQARISKIENGLSEVDDGLLDRLADVLGYPREFFYQEGGIRSLPATFFRKRKRLSRKALDRVTAEISIRTLNTRRLLRSAEIDAELSLPEIDPDEVGGAELAARAVRELWDIPRGPIENLIDLIERAGVIVMPCDFGTPDIDALGMRPTGLPPMVFVNMSAPVDRLRYTVAHEMGHLVMHRIPTETMEPQANEFAAEFLMPEIDIRSQLRKVTLSLLATLKRVWRVSMAALLERARSLGVIPKHRYLSLRKQLAARSYIRREPAELDPPAETPTVVIGLIQYHRRVLRYTTEQLARALNLLPTHFAKLYEQDYQPLRLVAG